MKRLFDQVKEDHEKTKNGFEIAINQLQKTLDYNNREIEIEKAGSPFSFLPQCTLYS